MQKIYAAVFGSGLGHASRVHTIAKKLQSESERKFLYSSFDEAYDYLESQKERVLYAPPLPIQWSRAGGVSGKDTLLRFPRALSDFSRQVAFEDRTIADYNPKVVISDSRLSAVFGAKQNSHPVITILNQIRILFPPRFRNTLVSGILERVEADILGLMWNLSDEILCPDLPPPYTISEANIACVDSAKKMKYTGFMVPKSNVDEQGLLKVKTSLGLDSRPIVFMQVSGPNASKKSFLDPAVECARSLGKKYNVVVSKGFPQGSSEPKKLANGGWVYEWCPVKDELFALSKVLVSRSGHTTIGQCIGSGKPSVLVPIYNHSEQIWNAEKAARLGLGIEIRSENLTPQNLEEAIENCVEDSEYKSNAERLQHISERYPGIDLATSVIKNFL